jgi:hypothetical protein
MMTQDRRSDFVVAAILVAIAAAPLLVFSGVMGSTAAYPLNSASYAIVIQNQCTQDLQNKMKSLSFSAVDSICRCVAETLLKELSIRNIKGTSGKSEKVSRSLVDAYEICYLKAVAP